MRNLSGKSLTKMLAFVFGIMWTRSGPAQTFKPVSVKGGARLVQIAAGGASIWARTTDGTPYVYKGKKFVLANTISLTQIAVGGGSLLQPDTVWGLDSAGMIYNAAKSGTSWVFHQMPGNLDFIAVGIGYDDHCHPYEIWGLSPSAQIYRFNYCIGDWDLIPGTLATMSVNGGEVWGVNGNSEAYRFDFPSRSFVFVSYLTSSVSVRAGDAWMVYHEKGGSNPVTRFNLQYGSSLFGDAPQVQVGGDGVWALRPTTGQVYRFELNQDPEHHFTQVAGVGLSSISVGSGAGVWGLDSSGKAYMFTTP